jgi:molybdenum cofactor synthesis domain-containing protein
MLVIGNEVLTGKVEESNIAVAARAFFDLGVNFKRVVVCVDDVHVIARDLRALAEAHDIVITSGGVGPTHDDVTLDAVAHAFEVPLDRDERLAAGIRSHFGPGVTEHHLRMANIPRGATLVAGSEGRWPTVKMGNVYVLPGVPKIFAQRMEAIRPLLDRGERFTRLELFLAADEGFIAERLERVARTFATVEIGSYLAPTDADHEVRLTFEGRNREDVHSAVSAFEALLVDERIVRRNVP